MANTDIKETDDEVIERHKPPFLRRVRIRGYKSIAFCDVTLEPLTVLVGRNGSGKSNFLDTKGTWIANRIKAYLSAIVEDVQDVKAVEYGGEYQSIRFTMRPGEDNRPREFDAASISDGTLRVLAALVAVAQEQLPFEPAIVGIEEPEAALHPRAMNALVDALDEATLRTQVLITTHSIELLDNPTIQPKNVRVVEMVDGQTIIGPVDTANVEIVQRKLGTLGDLERDNRLEADLDDRDRQALLQKNGQEPHA
jgi:predicted ATPase